MDSDISKAHSSWDAFFRFNPASRHRRRIIRSLIAGLPFDSVLDAGCGDGQLLHFLFHDSIGARKLRLAAFDSNRTVAPSLLTRLGAAYWNLDAEKETLPASYDLVIASEMIEHAQDDRQAARNLAKMSRRWVLATVPSGAVYPTDAAMGHRRHYTKASLRELFEPCGLRTVRCFSWGFPFHSLYRVVLNFFPGRILEEFGRRDYSPAQIFLCHLLYYLFYLNSHRKGGQLFYLGERVAAPRPADDL